MTHRQFVVWCAWLDIEFDRPDRSDWYAMQVAAEVRRVLAKNPGNIKTDSFKLKFQVGAKTVKPTRAEAAAAAKERSLARMTGNVIRVVVDRDGNILSVTKPEKK